ncbi:GMC family oxidoreductase [Cupriavidus sp. TA19]|uniref:GMC family oxidoreductase n=1 Tax=unclassified Cupriavidus TaxID=2640874 RepID=UPI000E2E7B84|nr:MULTISPECIES: GMC family oxidoreductase N-terminal domain-containing protein [unclassified Cupriavidus]BDB22850.1 GMC family oxidoreductase N-terminal domain-containing protein [Cupriavidus sp. P-10]GLC91718.1 GMC family oxidoreductase [Cupriavidus sp. TA19]
METTYDYVIVGAGSAGCALAGRLADSGDDTIALVEAGQHDHHVLVRTPAACVAMLPRAGARNYAYETVPQPGLNGRRGYQPRGRGLGGSSSINAMVYTRGRPADYDDWAAAGCDGWSWDDVLPYFRRSECNERLAGSDDDPLHGGNGPLHVSDLRTPNPFAERFIEAAQQAGIVRNDDFNGEEQEGVGWYQVTQHAGERWNAARAYLHGGNARDKACNGGRARLQVLTGTQALRIVFEGRHAAGVLVTRDGRQQLLRARRDVIVCAGSFGSPQLLMVSGVGPAAQLRELGIDVVHDLPGVGANLQDHLDIILHKRVAAPELFGVSFSGLITLLSEILRYRRERTGMLSSNFAEAGGFVRSRPELAEADLQLHFVVGMADNHMRRLNFGHGYSCHVCVLRPRSRGEVRLASADIREAPLIDPRYLSDVRDLDDMVAGVRIVRRIFAQPQLASFGGRELYSGHLLADGSDDADVREMIRAHADSIYHPVGTCRMGMDAMAVVDPQLRVRGVEGLRVVDASVMPTLVGGNTNAPAIMIGERAHDLIRYAPRVMLRALESMEA